MKNVKKRKKRGKNKKRKKRFLHLCLDLSHVGNGPTLSIVKRRHGSIMIGTFIIGAMGGFGSF